jgi:hypothetical protein
MENATELKPGGKGAKRRRRGTGVALLVGSERAIERCGGFAQRRDGVMQDGLVCLDLGDQMNAACGGLIEGFF